MNPDWSRWPLLIAAVVAVGIGVALLQSSTAPGAREFAGFVLVLMGGVAFGAFIESRKG